MKRHRRGECWGSGRGEGGGGQPFYFMHAHRWEGRKASVPMRDGGEMVPRWAEGPLWIVPPLIEMYPTQARTPLQSGPTVEVPPLASGRASPNQELAGKQRVGGMNLTCRWTECKGSSGWRGSRVGEGEG